MRANIEFPPHLCNSAVQIMLWLRRHTQTHTHTEPDRQSADIVFDSVFYLGIDVMDLSQLRTEKGDWRVEIRLNDLIGGILFPFNSLSPKQSRRTEHHTSVPFDHCRPSHHMLQIVNDDNLLLLHFRHSGFGIREYVAWRSLSPLLAFHRPLCACFQPNWDKNVTMCHIKNYSNKRADLLPNGMHQSPFARCSARPLCCRHTAVGSRHARMQRYGMLNGAPTSRRGKKLCLCEGELVVWNALRSK